MAFARHRVHFNFILRHKWLVYREGRKLNVPCWQLIRHDWSKFLPDEWFPAARTYSTPDGKPQYVLAPGVDEARRAHRRRNRHHWQYWLYPPDADNPTPLPMPDRFMREMVADWRGAALASGRTINDVNDWYAASRDEILLHPETRAWVDMQMRFSPESIEGA